MRDWAIPKKYIVPTTVSISAALVGTAACIDEVLCYRSVVVLAIVYVIVKAVWGNAKMLHALRDLAILEAGCFLGAYLHERRHPSQEMEGIFYIISAWILFWTTVAAWLLALIVGFFRHGGFRRTQVPRCAACGCDLTGNVGVHCPECGEPFDQEVLLKTATGTPLSAVPWDTERTSRGFFQTWWLAFAHRDKLAQQFPLVHDSRAAFQYSLICYVVTWSAILIGYKTLVSDFPWSWEECFTKATSIALGAWICENLIAGGLGWVIPPRGSRKGYHYWRGITCYTGGYMWLSIVALSPLLIPVTVEYFFLPLIAHISAPLVFIWWASGLGIVVFRKAQNWLRISLGCVWILLSVAIAYKMYNIVEAVLRETLRFIF